MNTYEKQSRSEHALSRREFNRLLWMTISSLIVTSCTPVAQATEVLLTPTAPSAPTVEPAIAPTIQPDLTSPPQVETPITTQEYMVGYERRIELAQPFTLHVPLETSQGMNRGAELNFHADIPLLVDANGYWQPGDANFFNENGEDNSAGNAFFVIPTSDPHHFIISAHSLIKSSPANLGIQAGYLESTGKAQSIYDHPLVAFDFGGVKIPAEIVNVHTIPTEQFIVRDKNAEDGIEPSHFETNLGKLGFTTSHTLNGEWAITIAGCQFETPGKPKFSEIGAEESANQTMITYKLLLS